MSNGTVIAVGDVVQNEVFCNYSNQLTSFLLRDKKIKSIMEMKTTSVSYF